MEEVKISMLARGMFLMKQKGIESGVALRYFFYAWMHDLYEIGFKDYIKIFTFVNDCASTMPCIAGASYSSNKIAFFECWFGCSAQQLNKEVKKTICSENNDTIAVFVT